MYGPVLFQEVFLLFIMLTAAWLQNDIGCSLTAIWTLKIDLDAKFFNLEFRKEKLKATDASEYIMYHLSKHDWWKEIYQINFCRKFDITS